MTPRLATDLAVGQEASRSVALTAALVAAFGDLVDDHAPVHVDAAFARARGFEGCIAHGLLIAACFSGLLGESLPGPASVINTLSVKLHQPGRVGDTLTCKVRVAHVSDAVGAVALDLEARREDGVLVLSGKASCSFPGGGQA